MKLYKIFLLLVLISFFNCNSAKQNSKSLDIEIETNPTFKLGETTYRYWVAGVKGGGSGIIVEIPVISNNNNIVIDSVFFRGMQTKPEPIQSGYVAHFKTEGNKKESPIKSLETATELKHKKPVNTHFYSHIEDNECLISYIEDNITKYLKIEKMIEKQQDFYPSAPPERR